MKYKLTVEVAQHIAQLLQLGIITGTDITAHLLTIAVTPSDDPTLLTLDPEYLERFNADVNKMVEDADKFLSEMLLSELANELPQSQTNNTTNTEELN